MNGLSLRLAERLNLRFPILVITLGVITLLDVLIPDFVPFVDELGLLVLTLLASRWKTRRTDARTDRSR